MDKSVREKIMKKLNNVEYQMHEVLGSLRVLENSMYLSSQNDEKDNELNRNHAFTVEMIAKAVEKCIDDISEISNNIKES